jgi:hypothetical protein
MAAQQIDKMFASMSFEGEDIDPDLMARVMAKMRDDMCAELSQQPVSETSSSSPTNSSILPSPPYQARSGDINSEISTVPPPNPTVASIRVCLLRFDGVAETQEFSFNMNVDDTAEKFLDQVLASRNLANGLTRLDMGSPDSISPATLVQPMWQTMREVVTRMEVAALSDKLTIHWYPFPPADSQEFHGRSHDPREQTQLANWVRVITLTRRSVFVPYEAETTTVFDMKKRVEELTGVAMEWQRLMFGNRIISTSTPESTLACEVGIRPGINIFLTHRIEGIEYGGDGAALN